MTVTIFDHGLDLMEPWESANYSTLLLQGSGYIVDPADEFVADLTPGSNECSAVGYSRQTPTSPLRVVDDTLHLIRYDCDDFDFGSIATGQTISGLVLFQTTGVDASSTLIAHFPIPDIATNDNPFAVVVNASGLIQTTQAP